LKSLSSKRAVFCSQAQALPETAACFPGLAINAKFRGPFLSFLSFAQYLLPLAVLEIYLRTRAAALVIEGNKFVQPK
jgi:hypothetical protein